MPVAADPTTPPPGDGRGRHRPSRGRDAARHRRLTPRGWAVTALALLTPIAIVASLLMRPTHHAKPIADPSGHGASTVAAAGHTSTADPPSGHITERANAAVVLRQDVSRDARARLRTLIAAAPAGGVSVAATDLDTGVTYTAGATSGMREASVAKVEILQTLLLRTGGRLTDTEQDDASLMIENSDNDAADDCLSQLGGPDVYSDSRARLGLDGNTSLTQGYYWGLNTSSAPQQLTLLRNLVDPHGPLTAAEQSYMLGLMRDVESDQRWGVPSIADPGTSFAVKNGWLAFDDDHDLWGVNSDALVTYHGAHLAMSVMTQHNPDEQSGIDRVQALAAAAARVVDP